MFLVRVSPGRVGQSQSGLAIDSDLRLGFVLDPQFDGPKGLDLVTLAALTAGGNSGSLTPTANGMSLDYSTVGTKYADYAAIPSFLPGTADFAVAVSGVFQPGTTTGVALSNYVLGSSGAQWRLQPNYNGSSTVSGSMSFLTYDGAALTNVGANSLISAGEHATFLGVRRGTTLELWKNGALVASATGTLRNINANTSIGFGWGLGYTYTAGGQRTLGFGILGTVPPGLAMSLSEDPRQILLSPPIDIWVPSAPGGTTNATITGTDGADVSGIAATVTTGAGITGTDGADNAVIAAANWTTAQIAGTDGADLSSVLADASGTTLATITATDGADAASAYAETWTTATLAAIDGADVAAVAGRVTTGAAIAGTDGADGAIIVAGGVGTTTAGISATDGADIAALTATGPIVLGIGGAIRQQSSRPRGPNASRSNIQRSTR